MDIHLENYQQQISDLQQQVIQLQRQLQGDSLQIENSPVNGLDSHGLDADLRLNDHDDCPQKVPVVFGEPLSLLACASPEVICYQLQKWIQDGEDLPIKNYSTNYEEKYYDIILKEQPESIDSQKLDYDEVIRLFSNVLTFISTGFLIIDPDQFKFKCKLYFNGEDVGPIFNCIILMIAALGEIYDQVNNLSLQTKLLKVPGIDFFRTVMNNLPSPIDYLRNEQESIEIIELFGLIALYLRMLDKKSTSATFTLNAIQLSISLNLYKNKQEDQRSNNIWWSIYCLNRFFTTRLGKPLLLNYYQIETPLPKDNTLKYYIELGLISERINRELFNGKLDDKIYNNNYKLISSIMHDLMNWKNSIPESLTMKITKKEEILDNNARVIYTLHMNYLHHIYLTCIPLLFKFAHIQLNNYRITKQIIPTNKLLTKNWLNLIAKLINSSQLSIKMFTKLYTQNLLRIFGFTDLDYLFSSNLVILIAMILNIDNSNFSFEDYLQLGMNLMNEMKIKGNMVASGKLSSLLNLIIDLKDILNTLGYSKLVEQLQTSYGESQTSYTPLNFLDDYQFVNTVNDIQFLNENDFSFLDIL